MISINTCSTTS